MVRVETGEIRAASLGDKGFQAAIDSEMMKRGEGTS